jgi:hypothetical protein
MSLILGPIHHWIFEQILLVEARCDAVAASLAKAVGNDAAEQWRAIQLELPGNYAGRPLEELASENIHGSLDAMIATVQGRESALVAWTLAREPERGMSLLEELYRDQGHGIGDRIQAHVEDRSAPGVFAALRELWLEGMPCDVRIGVTSQEADRVDWVREGFPLAGYWREAAVAPEAMLALHEAWQNGFVSAFGPGFRIEMAEASAGPDRRFEFSLLSAKGGD